MKAPALLRNSESGYVMYMVLVVLVILGTLAYITITNRGQAQLLAIRQLKKTQTGLLSESGIVLIEKYYSTQNGTANTQDDFNKSDSLGEYGAISANAKRFGGYAKISCTGFRDGVTCLLEGITGGSIPDILSPAITMTGGIPGLIIDDKTTITGDIVIPGGYLGTGKTKIPITGMQKQVRVSVSPALPFDVSPIQKYLEALSQKRISSLSDSNAFHGDVSFKNLPDSIVNRDKFVVIGNCEVCRKSLSNKEVYCAGTITIADGAITNGCLFVAESLIVLAGNTDASLFYSDKRLRIISGNHNSQFIATDTVFVSNKCNFGHLSSWISYRVPKNDTIKQGGVMFEEKGIYNGNCMCFTDSTKKVLVAADMPVVVLGKESVFHGTMIADASINIQSCKILGHVWARTIKTIGDDKGLYTNFLFNTSISAIDQGAFFLTGNTSTQLKLGSLKKSYVYKK